MNIFKIACNYLLLAILLFLPLSHFSCKNNKSNVGTTNSRNDREVQLDQEFENLLIKDSLGVTGADGVISFPLSNGKSIFMMGDSFLSPVINGKRDPQSKMINNSFIEVDKGKGTVKSIYKGSLDMPETMLTPIGSEKTKEYYWPGHGFEQNGIIHLFMSKFVDDESILEGWKFKFVGTDYLRLKPDNYEVISNEEFPFTNINNVHYGHSIVQDGIYTYIYGSHSKAGVATLHVARARLDTLTNQLESFKFYDGRDWNVNAESSKALTGIHKNVPEQFSVFKYKNKYVLLMQARELFKGNIYSYTSDTATGPWGNEQLLFHTTEQENTEDKIITYNAMAHPQYIEDKKLLVSYCVNSLEVSNIHEVNVEYYRPKFIRVPMEMIME